MASSASTPSRAVRDPGAGSSRLPPPSSCERRPLSPLPHCSHPLVSVRHRVPRLHPFPGPPCAQASVAVLLTSRLVPSVPAPNPPPNHCCRVFLSSFFIPRLRCAACEVAQRRWHRCFARSRIVFSHGCRLAAGESGRWAHLGRTPVDHRRGRFMSPYVGRHAMPSAAADHRTHFTQLAHPPPPSSIHNSGVGIDRSPLSNVPSPLPLGTRSASALLGRRLRLG